MQRSHCLYTKFPRESRIGKGTVSTRVIMMMTITK
ncbi:rCG43084, isoform CRA_b [Rattus norvegicus]|uniref:RCG43084, isoform CRA_b n=1 Tax=Rattus norvegicus TaxID=10116 RepID=A6IWC3_RAT|nr:rCG43084, isoform CRA_b [Rattus norvegicus]